MDGTDKGRDNADVSKGADPGETPRIPDADWPSSDFSEKRTTMTSTIPRSGPSRASTAAS